MKKTPLEDWIVDRSGIKERNRDHLEQYQLQRLAETLTYAKRNSRFYSEMLSGIRQSSLDSLQDFSNIPFTYPHQISQNPMDFLCVPQKEVSRIVTLNTSGTTGMGKRICFTEQDLDLTVDFFQFGMSCLTDESDRVMVLLPGDSYGSIGDLLKKALGMSNSNCVNYGILADPEDAANAIIKEDITCLVGIPIQILYLSRVRPDIFKSKIRKVLLSTDYVPEVMIRELHQLYGCKVFTHYGMTEMGYGGGVECEALNGYHMREADLYFEIVDPVTGDVLPDGQQGEVVFTTLNRQAMPLIRYRTGDSASFSENACACGTFLKTMTRVSGRIDNQARIGEGIYLYLRELDEVIFHFREVLDYKACITEKNLLKIDIISENKEIIRDIEFAVQNLLHEKPGHELDLAVIANPDSRPEKIVNSMIKRKLIDYRPVKEE